MPFPDRRTLDGLRGNLHSADRARTLAVRAFLDLDAALAANDDALGGVDCAEACLIAARSHVGANQLAEATDELRAENAAHGAADGLGHYTLATAPDRLRHRGLGSRRRSFTVREARERRLAGRVREAADCLHHAPVEAYDDIALKLAAVIAAGEAEPLDATAFPWSSVLHLLVDVTQLARA